MRFLLALLLTAAAPVFGATITITANTNWSAISPQPTAADDIIVKNGRTLTVNVANAVVGKIQLGAGNPSGGQGTLSFNAGSALTITSTGGHTGLLILGGGGQAGNLNMNSGGTLTLNGFTSTTVGTFTRGSGTIVLTGTNTLPTAAAYATYTNLSVSANTTTLGQNTTVAGNLNIIGGTLNTSTRTLSVTGTTTVSGTLTLTNTTTLTGATTIGGTLNITSATGNKTLGAVTINSGGTWNSSVAGNVFLSGNFTNNGTFTSNLAIYTFNGAAAQTFTGTNGGSTSFSFLTLNNASGLTLTGTHNLQVTTLLTLAAGKITTGANHVYVSNGSNISGATTGSFIEGNLRKPFSSGNLSRLFEVGGNSGTNYSPASITFASVSASGDVTVSTTSGQHPQIASSGLDDATPALLNRYWSITNNGVGFTTYGASFSYASSEIDAGATASTFLAVRYASPSWNPTTLNGTPTTTTLLITGETGFGDFAIGNTGAASGSIGRFNAYDPPPVTPSGSITGNIRTKIAGTLFTLTIVHLDSKGTGTQNMNDNITVELLDGSPTGGTMTNNCSSNWTTVIATVAGNISGGNFSTAVSFTVPNSWRDVRVKVTRAGGGEIGCSTDNFAIRPSSISIVARDASWQTAGTARTLNNTSPTGGVVHAASTSSATTPRPFTLQVTVSPATATNYSPAFTFKPGSPACVLPGVGCTTGTLSIGSWSQSGNVYSAQAHYSETGTFNLELEDATFADVDTADTAASVRTLAQSPAPVEIGRFVPDRFVISSPTTAQFVTFNNAACAARSFTYVGQPFWFSPAGTPSITLSAVNAGGGVTANYTLDTANSKPVYTQTFADATAPAGAALGTSQVAAVTFNVAGGTTTYSPSGTLSYTRGTTPVSPFNAAITLTLAASDSTETPGDALNGVIGSTPLVFNSGPSAIAFDSGNQFRYGVLRLIDVFGPLTGNANGKAPVAVEAQYWNGTAFVTNTADNCTSLVEKNFVLYGHGGAASGLVPTPTAGSNGALTLSAATLASGLGRVDVTAPAIGAPGNVRICLDLDAATGVGDTDCGAVTPAARAYLQGRWMGTGSYDRDPSATVGFGVFGAQPRNFIYFRENY